MADYFTNSDKINELYSSLHMEKSPREPKYGMFSESVEKAFTMDNMIDYSRYFEMLIAEKSPVLVYAGEFDIKDGPRTQEEWLRRLNFEGKEEFWY